MDFDGNSIMKNRKGLFIFSLCFFSIFYIAAIAIQTVSNDMTINMVLAMFLLVFCVSINIILGKTGLIVSFIFNLIQCISCIFSLIMDKDITYLYILIAAVSAAIIDLIVQVYISQIHTKLFAYKQLYSTARSTLIARQEEDSAISESMSRTSLIVKNSASQTIAPDGSSFLLHSNYIDTLTTLPNRAKIVEKIDTLIDESIIESQTKNSDPHPIDVIYLGVDNFIRLTEELGHQITDLFVQSAAHRIREAADNKDLVGRLAGCEFVIVSNRGLSKDELNSYAQKLMKAVNNAFADDSGNPYLSISVGLSSYPETGSFSGELLKYAEKAMYDSRESGKNKISYAKNEYSAPSIFSVKNIEEISQMFRDAFDRNEIYMVYQPQFSGDKKLTGFEAFLRWDSDQFGVMTAREFIDAADRSGFIYDLGKMCIAQSLSTLKKINDINPNMTMSINFSGLQLKTDDIAGILKKEISKTGCDPKNINIDIPEDSLNTPDRVSTALNNISDMDISMALDNFGRGYSSLNNIPLLPISTVKLDGRFTDNLQTNESKRVITASIIKLLHEIDIKVCATGVESEEQFNVLKEFGCDAFQGEYMNHPVKLDGALTLVKQ